MYIEDQAKYSVIANRRRAIPAIQDGLKPVQRRVMYGAFVRNLNTPSAHKKSAQLVGMVMGDYHPHGDSCLGGDTKLYLLDNTTITIEQAYLSGVKELHILATDKLCNIVPAIATHFRVGKKDKKEYNIILSNGAIAKCTDNHPFRTQYGGWCRADELKPNTRLYSQTIKTDSSNRLTIAGNTVHSIVHDYYYGKPAEGYDRHHVDGNYLNNLPSNLVFIFKKDHVSHHGADESSLMGLQKGREEMFGENGKFRDKIARKNSVLATEYNKDQGIRRFQYVINIMREKNMPITEEVYESFRGQVYNLPMIDRLLKKHPEYGSSFEELVNYQPRNLGEIYKERMDDIKPAVQFEEKQINKPVEFYHSSRHMLYSMFDRIIDYGLELTVENYYKFIDIIHSKSNVDPEKINYLINLYKIERPYIVDVQIIEYPEELTFYDFTVEGHENMMIPVASEYNEYISNVIGYNVPMICVHNSIYEAIVTLSSWFKTKYPLMYGYGNWGNVSGAGAASMRYTECALSKFGYDVMIDELAQSNNIVDWLDAYSRDKKEPEYLPAKLPILLINGSFGIGVGMSINVPSHNIGEVIDATINLINNPKKDVVLIPDFPQECELVDTDWKEICNTGRGSFKVRGKIITEQDKKGNYILHIISLPDQVNCTAVYEKICSMISDKQLPMIKDIYNSLKNGKPDIIIHLRPGSDPSYVKQVIYAKTQVQQTVSVNFEAVSMNGIDLERFSYKNYLLQFIDQRMSIKFRLYCNKLQKVMTRHLQVDAFVKVIQSKEFDKIMNMIRKYNGTDDTTIVEYMIKTCNISDIQAKFILGRTLPQLSKGHLKNYIAERDELQKKIDIFMKFVTDDGTLIKNEIITELKEMKAKYNTPRLCNVISGKESEDIPKGTFKIVITEKNYIRKIPDVDKVGVVRKDNPKFILRVDNAENILIFDNKGKVFNLPIHKIPISDKSAPGTDIRILVRNLTSDIAAVFYEPIFTKISKSNLKHYLTILTKSNTIKKLDIEDFLNVSPSGLLYSKIRPEDEVVGVSLVPHNLDIAICSGHKVLRCKLKDVPLYKRNASGAKAMNTNGFINGMSVLYPEASDIVVITKNGKFNRFNIAMLDCHSRGRSGNKVIKLDSTDEILNVYGVDEHDIIRVLTPDGVEEVAVANIKIKSSIAAGTKMITSKGPIVRADIVRPTK